MGRLPTLKLISYFSANVPSKFFVIILTKRRRRILLKFRGENRSTGARIFTTLPNCMNFRMNKELCAQSFEQITGLTILCSLHLILQWLVGCLKCYVAKTSCPLAIVKQCIIISNKYWMLYFYWITPICRQYLK